MDKKPKHGWFEIYGRQSGDRTVIEQCKGLDVVDFRNRTVLDIGCAEGMISKYAINRGASLVHGIDIIPRNIVEALRQNVNTPTRFFLLDAETMIYRFNEIGLERYYDVVLLLSVLHKLRHPDYLLAFLSQVTNEMVIRLPGPILNDVRSLHVVIDIKKYLASDNFVCVAEPETCVEPKSGKPEWMGVFKRTGG